MFVNCFGVSTMLDYYIQWFFFSMILNFTFRLNCIEYYPSKVIFLVISYRKIIAVFLHKNLFS